MRNKIVAAIFLFQILFAGVAAAETLTIESCVRTALEKHPDMVAAESKVVSKKAAVGQSAADSRPQIKGGPHTQEATAQILQTIQEGTTHRSRLSSQFMTGGKEG